MIFAFNGLATYTKAEKPGQDTALYILCVQWLPLFFPSPPLCVSFK